MIYLGDQQIHKPFRLSPTDSSTMGEVQVTVVMSGREKPNLYLNSQGRLPGGNICLKKINRVNRKKRGWGRKETPKLRESYTQESGAGEMMAHLSNRAVSVWLMYEVQ